MRLLTGIAPFVLCGLIGGPLSAAAQPAEITFDHHTVRDGLLSPTVAFIGQDGWGRLVVQTDEGVQTFNGTLFAPLVSPVDTTLSGNSEADVVAPAHEGGTWLVRASDVFRIGEDGHVAEHLRLTQALPAGVKPTVLLADSRGGLWIGSTNGVIRIVASGGEPTSFGDDAPRGSISFLYEDIAGSIWVGTDEGLWIWSVGTDEFDSYISVARDRRTLSSDDITSIIEDARGTVWVGTSSGLNRFDRATEVFTRYFRIGRRSATLSGNNVTALAATRDGTLWVATDNGLNRYDAPSDSFVRISASPLDDRGLPSNRLTTLFEDSFGMLWIGTENAGMASTPIVSRALVFYHAAGGPRGVLQNADVRALAEDRIGRLWIGTMGGLHVLDRSSGSVARYASAAPRVGRIASDRVNDVLIDARGDVWIGTSSGLERRRSSSSGFARVRPNLDRTRQGLTDILSLYESPGEAGILWVGTAAGLIRLETPRLRATVLDAQRPSGIANARVTHIDEDATGKIWVGTSRGVFMFDRDERSFGVPTLTCSSEAGCPAVETVEVTTIMTSGQNVFVGTARNGLLQADVSAGTMSTLTTAEGLPSDRIAGVEAGPDGELWIATDKGLLSLGPDGAVRQLTVEDGSQGSSFNSGAHLTSASGELLFGGRNGFNVFDPAAVRGNPYPPRVRIVSAQVDDKYLGSAGDDVRIKGNVRRATFEYEGVHLANSARVTYRYLLVGYDEDWIFAGDRTKATYTNLPHGKYRFDVQAISAAGVPGATAQTIEFDVRRQWWRAPWLLPLLVLGLVALFIWSDRKNRVRVEDKLRNRSERRLALMRDELHAARTEAAGLRTEFEQYSRDQEVFLAEKERLLGQARVERDAIRTDLMQTRQELNAMQRDLQDNPGPTEAAAMLAPIIERLASGIGKSMQTVKSVRTKLASSTSRNRPAAQIESMIQALESTTAQQRDLVNEASVLLGRMRMEQVRRDAEEIDLNRLIRTVVSEASEMIGRKNGAPQVRVTTNLDDAVGSVEVVPKDIERVVEGLVTRALESVSARVANGEPYEAEIAVTTLAADDFVEIRVRDNGASMDFENAGGDGLDSDGPDLMSPSTGTLSIEPSDENVTTYLLRIPRSSDKKSGEERFDRWW